MEGDDPVVEAGPVDPLAALGPRAARTRLAILDAARELFLGRGYAGTSVADITTACGISRAGFYTYFRDKRDVFSELGRASYASSLAVVTRLAELPAHWTGTDVEGWVRAYFAHLDVHGAFVLAALLSAPMDAAFRADSRRTQMRVARGLGILLRERRHDRSSPPEAIGLVVVALVERCWYQARTGTVTVAEADIVSAAATMIVNVFTAR